MLLTAVPKYGPLAYALVVNPYVLSLKMSRHIGVSRRHIQLGYISNLAHMRAACIDVVVGTGHCVHQTVQLPPALQVSAKWQGSPAAKGLTQSQIQYQCHRMQDKD